MIEKTKDMEKMGSSDPLSDEVLYGVMEERNILHTAEKDC